MVDQPYPQMEEETASTSEMPLGAGLPPTEPSGDATPSHPQKADIARSMTKPKSQGVCSDRMSPAKQSPWISRKLFVMSADDFLQSKLIEQYLPCLDDMVFLCGGG